MKKLLLSLLLLSAPLWAANTYTTRTGIPKPADHDLDWGTTLRAAFDIIDSSMCVVGGVTTNTNILVSSITFADGSILGTANTVSVGGSITSSPQFEIPYYVGAGSTNTLLGDSGFFTDGAGSVTMNTASINGALETGSTIRMDSGFMALRAASPLYLYNSASDGAFASIVNDGGAGNQKITMTGLDGITLVGPVTASTVTVTSSATFKNITITGTCTGPGCGSGGGGATNGSIVASPQFQLPYYSVAGTTDTLKGDSKIITDGSGNMHANGIQMDNAGSILFQNGSGGLTSSINNGSVDEMHLYAPGGVDIDYGVSVGSITIGGTNPIVSTQTLQSGATFYVSSGTVLTQLNVGTPGSNWVQYGPNTISPSTFAGSVTPIGTLTMTNASASGSPKGFRFDNPNTGSWVAGFDTISASPASKIRSALTISSATTITNGLTVDTITVTSSGTFNGGINISSNVLLSGSAGSNGQFLTSGGVGTIPTWTTSAGGGASSLATALNGVRVTSPTVGLNFLSPLVASANSSTTTVSVDLSTTANASAVATSTAAIGTATGTIVSNLLASSPTWTGENNWTTPAQSTFTYGLSVGSFTVNGSSAGAIQLSEGLDGGVFPPTVGKDNFWASSSSHAFVTNYNNATSTGIIIVSTSAITVGHYPVVSALGTIIDGGGTSVVAQGPLQSVQYNNAGILAGSNNFQFNGTSVTIKSSVTVNGFTGLGGSDNTIPAYFNIFMGDNSTNDGSAMFNIGSAGSGDQFLIKNGQPFYAGKSGGQLGNLVVGDLPNNFGDTIHAVAPLNQINFYTGQGVTGEMSLETNAGDIVFLPSTVVELRLSSGGITVSTQTTFQSSSTFNGTIGISSGLVLSGSAGTNGQALTSGGPGTVPTWTTISGAGGSGSSTTTVQINGVDLSTQTTNFNYIPGTGILISGSTPTVNNVSLTYSADTAVMLSRATDQVNTDKFCFSGTGNTTYTCSLNPTLTSYTTGQCLTLITDTSNTTSATLNVDTLGSKSILSPTGGALSAGNITAGMPATVCLSSPSSTGWIIQGGSGGGSGDMVLASTQTSTGAKTFNSYTNFGGSLTVSGFGANNGLTIVPNTSIANDVRSGALVVDNSRNADGFGLVVRSTAQTQGALNALAFLDSASTSYNEPMLWIRSQSTSTIGANADILIHSNNPDIEFRELDKYTGSGGIGEYEMAVNFDELQFNFRNSANTAYQQGLGLSRTNGLKFKEWDDGGDYIAFRATTTLPGVSYNYVWPDTTPTANQYLGFTGTNGSDYNLGWITPSVGGGSSYALEPATVTINAARGIIISSSIVVSTPSVVVTSTLTLTSTMSVVLASAPQNTSWITLTLPSAVSNPGLDIMIYKVDRTTGSIKIQGAENELIEGTGTIRLDAQFQHASLHSLGAVGWGSGLGGIQYTPTRIRAIQQMNSGFSVGTSSTQVMCAIDIPVPVAVTGFAYYQNSSANMAFGLLDANGNVAVSTGPIANTSGTKVTTVTPVMLAPGRYYVSVLASQTIANLMDGSGSNNSPATAGCRQIIEAGQSTIQPVTIPLTNGVNLVPSIHVLFNGGDTTF